MTCGPFSIIITAYPQSSEQIQQLEQDLIAAEARKNDEAASLHQLEQDKQALVLEVMSRGEQLQNRQKQVANLTADLQVSFARLKEEQDMFK